MSRMLVTIFDYNPSLHFILRISSNLYQTGTEVSYKTF